MARAVSEPGAKDSLVKAFIGLEKTAGLLELIVALTFRMMLPKTLGQH